MIPSTNCETGFGDCISLGVCYRAFQGKFLNLMMAGFGTDRPAWSSGLCLREFLANDCACVLGSCF